MATKVTKENKVVYEYLIRSFYELHRVFNKIQKAKKFLLKNRVKAAIGELKSALRLMGREERVERRAERAIKRAEEDTLQELRETEYFLLRRGKLVEERIPEIKSKSKKITELVDKTKKYEKILVALDSRQGKVEEAIRDFEEALEKSEDQNLIKQKMEAVIHLIEKDLEFIEGFEILVKEIETAVKEFEEAAYGKISTTYRVLSWITDRFRGTKVEEIGRIDEYLGYQIFEHFSPMASSQENAHYFKVRFNYKEVDMDRRIEVVGKAFKMYKKLATRMTDQEIYSEVLKRFNIQMIHTPKFLVNVLKEGPYLYHATLIEYIDLIIKYGGLKPLESKYNISGGEYISLSYDKNIAESVGSGIVFVMDAKKIRISEKEPMLQEVRTAEPILFNNMEKVVITIGNDENLDTILKPKRILTFANRRTFKELADEFSSHGLKAEVYRKSGRLIYKVEAYQPVAAAA